ncbi:MAG: PIN domain-containing protein [Acidobacteriota bacterium]|nr:PIN domain-containing protein [Acidobacteriota bacterium]
MLDSGLRGAINEFPKRYISAVTPCEVDLKPEFRKPFTFEMLGEAFQNMSVKMLPITFEHVGMLRRMRRYQDYRDPFDRVLIAQAYTHKIAIATYDTKFQRYPDLQLLGL